MKNNRLEELRETNIVNYLRQKGILPEKTRGRDFWYRSPFRQERTASFKVNVEINRYYDFGEGSGGNFIDLAMRLENCSVAELLRGYGSYTSQPLNFIKPANKTEPSKIEIINTGPIDSLSLLHLLDERRIPREQAFEHTREIHCRIGKRSMKAIGFKNCSGGWELRNRLFKGSTSPKDISLIRKNGSKLAVFEGFMDFLSAKATFSEMLSGRDILVLNSVSLFERAVPSMEGYRQIELYLDNDHAGNRLTQLACSMTGNFTDQRHLYENYKDINDYLCQNGRLTEKTYRGLSH